jgi:hypothetical protein
LIDSGAFFEKYQPLTSLRPADLYGARDSVLRLGYCGGRREQCRCVAADMGGYPVRCRWSVMLRQQRCKASEAVKQ